jgi:hypothetical protein
LQRALNLSRAEAEFQQGVQQRGGTYERGGGSGASRGRNPISRLFQRATSQRESPVVQDYNLAAGGSRIMTVVMLQVVAVLVSFHRYTLHLHFLHTFLFTRLSCFECEV